MNDGLSPDVEWFDTSASWSYAIKRATFFGGYCGQKTVVRWIPSYHRWYIGFRKRGH
jgi:hypothetical protein